MFKLAKQTTGLLALASIGLATSLAVPAARAADGNNSLAAVLTAKGSFDSDGTNYDVVTAAILAVLSAKPSSPVSALTDGTVALTAFIPNDTAFVNLVFQLTGSSPATEQAAFNAVAGLGIDTVENVLLYHVVVGPAILSPDVLKANGATLNTALAGKSIAVKVDGTTITLGDYDNLASNPKVILSQVDLNKGNQQVAHGVDAVLLPVGLLKLGMNSLASILTAKISFDKDGKNFDILTAAVLAVLQARPNSDVKALTDGSIPLTAFIPSDRAFLDLVKALTGKRAKSEAAAFNTIASLGIPKVERILKFHVVPGTPILSGDALKANGAMLTTAAAGKTITVLVNGNKISLNDYNKKLANPKVILSQVDINKGNYQVAHGIDFVLMPTK